jgi:hypothetical protein
LREFHESKIEIINLISKFKLSFHSPQGFNKIAQGNALGIGKAQLKALKGRNKKTYSVYCTVFFFYSLITVN